MQKITSNIKNSWKKIFRKELKKGYFLKLQKFLLKEREKYTVYPKETELFSAFNLCSFNSIKAVIVGQDPYHKYGQAHGLAFSVPAGTKIPSSLRNILKELESDLNIEIPNHGNLSSWAKQGVLLINVTLSVRDKEPGSHQKKGWEKFTSKIIETISKEKKGIVFMLWGNYAKNKSSLIDLSKHHVLTASHPSPLSAYNGFFGCKHFSKTNNILRRQNLKTIQWEI